jgi:polyhydroxyalkanoate synthesis repressor PhaR
MQKKSNGTSETIVIKKYPNRRLYNTASSRYVNLDDVADLVRDGADVQVVESRTGEDITRVILTQVILEDARSTDRGLPLDLLRNMVSASDESMQELLGWYLDTVLEGYRRASDAFQDHIRRVGGPTMAPLDMAQDAFDPARLARLLGWPGPVGPPSEVDQLRQRVAELEEQLEELTSTERPKRKRNA